MRCLRGNRVQYHCSSLDFKNQKKVKLPSNQFEDSKNVDSVFISKTCYQKELVLLIRDDLVTSPIPLFRDHQEQGGSWQTATELALDDVLVMEHLHRFRLGPRCGAGILSIFFINLLLQDQSGLDLSLLLSAIP